MKNSKAVDVLTRINSESKYRAFGLYYYEDHMDDMAYVMEHVFDGVSVVLGKQGRKYYDCPCAFDIETTNITTPVYRHAVMYHWQMLINKTIVMGRTWDSWFSVIDLLTKHTIDKGRWAVIYVHNLGYEFQFIRHFFDWKSVFARRKRAPIYAETTSNIEFRCSYMLCNTSLAEMTKDYGLEIAKEKDYNYNKLRHSHTPMTKKEIRYCINDVASLYYYINNERERNGDITKIPYTQTGYVRRELARRCYPTDNRYQCSKYHGMISKLTVTPDEYYTLKRAYSGGFTHACALNVNVVHENVESYDRASAYPTEICSEKFPMSTGVYHDSLTLDEYRTLLDGGKCIVADFYFTGIRAKPEANEHYLSMGKCRDVNGLRLNSRRENGKLIMTALEDNNKIVEADILRTTMTEVDFGTVERYYDYDDVEITGAYVYDAGFLPKEVIQLCIDLYAAKTQLKGVDGREDEYLRSKQMLNSVYGMMVTDIVQQDILYTAEHTWGKGPLNVEDVIDKYNRSRTRTLFYPWGVYVTAYARMNLLEAIWAMGYDYVYSDTDSVKILNGKAHAEYFAEHNAYITYRIEHILDVYGIDKSLAAPRDPKGKAHPLGHFELDEVSARFKTLGAKRYLSEYIGKDGQRALKMTVAGVNKLRGRDYLARFKDPFKAFAYDLEFPAGYSGKLVATYTDEPISGEIDDGKTVEPYEELSCTHLMEASYNMDVAEDYLNFQHLLLDKRRSI